MLTIPSLALRNLQHQSTSSGLLGGASSSSRRSRTHLPPQQDGPLLPSFSSPSSSSLLPPTWRRSRHASIYGTTRSSADEVLLGPSGRAAEAEERYGSSESRVVSEGVGEVRETRVENLDDREKEEEEEEMEGSQEALFLKRASEIESGKVGVKVRDGGRRERRVLRKKARRDSKKVGGSSMLFQDTEIGAAHDHEKVEGEDEDGRLLEVADLGREIAGDHEDGVLNSEGKRRFSRRLTSVGCVFNRVSNKVLKRVTGFATSTKCNSGSNSSDGAGEKGEESEALLARDPQSPTDTHSQKPTVSSPIASERELRGSGSSRQTLYSPCSSPAETMPVTPSYTRDDGGPLEPCPTKIPPSQPIGANNDDEDDEDMFFPAYSQALPSSSPNPPHQSPSPLTSPSTHPSTPPHLRPRLSSTQSPLTITQYAQMIQLSLFHAERTGVYSEEGISRAYSLAPGNATKVGEQRKAAEIWRGKVEAEGERRGEGGGGGDDGVGGLEREEEKGERRRISLRRLFGGGK
ncbi:hypothetical protein KC326_g9489 [Hortaea werneckii]|nr:hypothetical protein KC326_g9489 [Hortaea werneckii]